MSNDGLSDEARRDVEIFTAKVKADAAAERRKPHGAVTRVEAEEFILSSWDESTTSLGVELWLTEQGLVPACEEDLHLLRSKGFPKSGAALVALSGSGSRVHVLHRDKQGEIKIEEAERVLGHSDDLWYPGADWNSGTIFPAKQVSRNKT